MAKLNFKNMSKIISIAIKGYLKLKLYIRYCFNVTKYKRIGCRGGKILKYLRPPNQKLKAQNLRSAFDF
jgi:hypothetical protein